MKTEKMEFMEKQPQVTACNGGRRVLVLMNECVEKRSFAPAIVDGEGGLTLGETETQTVWVYDGVWLDVAAQTDAAVLEAAKKRVAAEIADYDKSAAVNAFLLCGKTVWVDKDTRMGLRQNIADKTALGEKDITMWMGGTAITLACETAERIMCSLENYAYECYNVTAAHNKRVAEAETLDGVLEYDYTRGYPEKVKVEL